jgi:hypothetical protein
MRNWLFLHLGLVSTGGIALLITVGAMLKGAIYRRVLGKLDYAKRLIEAEHFIETGSFEAFFTTEELIRRSGCWPWLAKLALQWEVNKKKGLL